jgi:hypothetical protein
MLIEAQEPLREGALVLLRHFLMFGLVALSGFAGFGLFEAAAGAVHLKDMDVVGKAVEQRAGQAL